MFRKLFESLSPKPRKPEMGMAADFQTPATIDDGKPFNQPIDANQHQGPSQSWIDHAYPLKQVVIEIRGNAHTTVACLIDELDQVFLKLIKGEKAAQGGDEGISHRFAYEDQASGPSFFDVPMPTSPEGPSSEQVLNVRLQGTRHSSFADINNLIASVMNDINTKKTSGCSHDDDFGYSFTLERAPILN